jgi:hypothetical protein
MANDQHQNRLQIAIAAHRTLAALRSLKNNTDEPVNSNHLVEVNTALEAATEIVNLLDTTDFTEADHAILQVLSECAAAGK